MNIHLQLGVFIAGILIATAAPAQDEPPPRTEPVCEGWTPDRRVDLPENESYLYSGLSVLMRASAMASFMEEEKAGPGLAIAAISDGYLSPTEMDLLCELTDAADAPLAYSTARDLPYNVTVTLPGREDMVAQIHRGSTLETLSLPLHPVDMDKALEFDPVEFGRLFFLMPYIDGLEAHAVHSIAERYRAAWRQSLAEDDLNPLCDVAGFDAAHLDGMVTERAGFIRSVYRRGAALAAQSFVERELGEHCLSMLALAEEE